MVTGKRRERGVLIAFHLASRAQSDRDCMLAPNARLNRLKRAREMGQRGPFAWCKHGEVEPGRALTWTATTGRRHRPCARKAPPRCPAALPGTWPSTPAG